MITLMEILTRYMTPFEARLCVQEMRRCGVLPDNVKTIEIEAVRLDEKEDGDGAD